MGSKKRSSDIVEEVENHKSNAKNSDNKVSSEHLKKKIKKGKKNGEVEIEIHNSNNNNNTSNGVKPMERKKKRKALDKKKHRAAFDDNGEVKPIVASLEVKEAESRSSNSLPEFHIGVFKDLGSADVVVREAAAERLVNGEPALAEAWPKKALDLPSCTRLSEPKSEVLLRGASKLKKLLDLWSGVVLCLYEAGKKQKTTLLDLYHEALDPKLYNLRHSDHLELQPDFQRNHGVYGQVSRMQKGGLIGQTIRQVRDLPAAALFQLLEKWSKQTDGVNEVHEKIKELQLQEKFEDTNFKEPATNSRRQTGRNNGNLDKGTKALNEKASALITCMARDHMQPIECIPFHEIVCFKNVDKLQAP